MTREKYVEGLRELGVSYDLIDHILRKFGNKPNQAVYRSMSRLIREQKISPYLAYKAAAGQPETLSDSSRYTNTEA